MKFRNYGKKTLTGLLALSMILSSVNVTAFAAEDDESLISNSNIGVVESEPEENNNSSGNELEVELPDNSQKDEKSDGEETKVDENAGQQEEVQSDNTSKSVPENSEESSGEKSEEKTDEKVTDETDKKDSTEQENTNPPGESEKSETVGTQESQNSDATEETKPDESKADSENKSDAENNESSENEAVDNKEAEKGESNNSAPDDKEEAPAANNESASENNSDEKAEPEQNGNDNPENAAASEEQKNEENSSVEAPAESPSMETTPEKTETPADPRGEKIEYKENPMVWDDEVLESAQISDSGIAYPLAVFAPVTAAFGAVDENHELPHTGVDLGAAQGTAVLAAGDGVVTNVHVWEGYLDSKDIDSYGNMVEITLDDGTVVRYGHLETISVEYGEQVVAGRKIGTVGTTGHSDGYHLHFEVIKDGVQVDPMSMFVIYTGTKITFHGEGRTMYLYEDGNREFDIRYLSASNEGAGYYTTVPKELRYAPVDNENINWDVKEDVKTELRFADSSSSNVSIVVKYTDGTTEEFNGVSEFVLTRDMANVDVTISSSMRRMLRGGMLRSAATSSDSYLTYGSLYFTVEGGHGYGDATDNKGDVIRDDAYDGGGLAYGGVFKGHAKSEKPPEDNPDYSVEADGPDYGEFVYCGDAAVPTPGLSLSSTAQTADSREGTVTEITDATMRKILYYGYGGKEQWTGFRDAVQITDYTGSHNHSDLSTDDIAMYLATHFAINVSNGNYPYGEGKAPSPENAVGYKAFMDFIATAEEPTEDFKVLELDWGYGQRMYMWVYTDPAFIQVYKDTTDADDAYLEKYPIAGTKYAVYTDYNEAAAIARLQTNSNMVIDEGVSAVEVLTITDSGYSGVGRYEQGMFEGKSYYVVEVERKEGWKWDRRVIGPIILEKNSTETSPCLVTSVEEKEIKMDPVDILLQKMDSQTGRASAQGVGSLADAEYTVKYYDYISDNPTGNAVEWVFKTDADGYIRYSDSYKVSGPALFVDNYGVPSFPIGTVTIQETKAPYGYKKSGEIFITHFTLQDDGTVRSDAPNGRWDTLNKVENLNFIAEEKAIHAGAKFSKIDSARDTSVPQGDATLKDAAITIYNNSGKAIRMPDDSIVEDKAAVITIRTDAQGNASVPTSLLPVGTYYAKETSPSRGYRLNTSWQKTIVVTDTTPDGYEFDFTDSNNALEQEVTSGVGTVKKYDTQLNANAPQGDASFVGIKFALINRSVTPVVVKNSRGEDTLYGNNAIIRIFTMSASGTFDTPELPYGTYEMVELAKDNSASEGAVFSSSMVGNSQYANDSGYLFGGAQSKTFSITEDNQKVDIAAFKNAPDKFGISIKKEDIENRPNGAQGDAKFEGISFAIVNRSANKVVVNGTTYNVGDVVKILTTNEDGMAATAEKELPYGTYDVYELREDYSIAVGDNYDNASRTLGVSIYANASHSYLFEARSYHAVLHAAPATGGDVVIVFEDYVTRAGAAFFKVDADTMQPFAQGQSTLAGAKVTVWNISQAPILYMQQAPAIANVSRASIETYFNSVNANAGDITNDAIAAIGTPVVTLVTDENGLASIPKNGLPYGTYLAKETAPSKGYTLNPEWFVLVNVDENGKVHEYKSENEVLPETVIRGGARFVKVDGDKEADGSLPLNSAQGDATLAGAEITIYNDNDFPIYAKNSDGELIEVQPGAAALVIKTNLAGEASTVQDALPYGFYHAVETAPSRGYKLNSDWRVDFAIRENNIILDTTDVENKGDDKSTVTGYVSGERELENGKLSQEVIRGGAIFEKYDAETNSKEAFGDASLADAKITIYNNSEREVWAADEEGNFRFVAKDEAVITLSTDENGHAETSADALPYGTYYAKETEPSKGYLLNEQWQVDFQIREDGVVIDTDNKDFFDENGKSDDADAKSIYFAFNAGSRTSEDGRLLEEVKRNDLEFEKLNIDGLVKPNIPFAIDRIEMVDGKWVVLESHVIVSDADGEVNTSAAFRPRTDANRLDQFVNKGVFSPDSELDSEAGIWFGGTTPDNERGALVYGTYRIRELQCKDNVDNHEDLLMSDPIIVHDDYVMVGKRLTDDPVRTVSQNTRVFGYHALIDLEVELTSEFTEKEYNTHSASCKESVAVRDVIHYTHLKTSSRYRMEATVMVKGTSIEIGTFSQDFQPERSATSTMVDTAEGDITFEFTINTLAYEGKKLVSVVRLYEIMDDADGDYEVMIHSHNVDHDDVEQEIAVPTMVTHAVDAATGDNVASARPNKETTSLAKIVDSVELFGLAPQEQYVLEATLVDRATGEQIADKQQQFFTARRSEDNDESVHYVDMTDSFIVTLPAFEFDASAFENRTLVVYETLYKADNGTKLDGAVLVHESKLGRVEYDDNIEAEFVNHNGQMDDNRDESKWYKSSIDENQSIHYPKVRTSASDAMTGDNVGVVSENAVILDNVILDNLIPGMSYTIKGTIVYQSDVTDEDGTEHKAGDVIPYKDGSVAEKTFVATAAHEEHELSFVIDSRILEGNTVTVFEDLYHNNVLLAVHNDLSDEGQSIHYPKIRTTAKDGKTQDEVGTVEKEATIVDTVKYTNLLPDKEYVIDGHLVYQSDFVDSEGIGHVAGEVVRSVTGEPYTASAMLKAGEHEADGEIDLTFNIDSRKLEGATTVVFEDLYHNNVEVTTHSDIHDESQTIHYPKIRTLAWADDTEDHITLADDKAIITDTVTYENLVPGKTYTISGQLWVERHGSNQSPEGFPMSWINLLPTEELASTTIVPEEANGTADVVFEINPSKYEGGLLIIFEELIHNDVVVTVHKDPGDKSQMVYVPEIRTTAIDEVTRDHIGLADTPMTVIDTVKYTNLLPGKTYVIKGTLMDRETGEPLLVNGEKVVASREFTATSADGEEELTFTFDGIDLKGHTLVAFEEVYYKDILVGIHAEIEDETQAEHIPDGYTTAQDDKTVDNLAFPAPDFEMTDTVHYENVLPGREYEVVGTIMLKETGEPLLDAEGNKITETLVFTAPDSFGDVKLHFAFDASLLEGKTIVVFEDMFFEGNPVFVHADINCEEQSIHFPEIHTNAFDNDTMTQTGKVAEKTTLVDRVTFNNLIPGKEYVITGVVMNRATGEALLDEYGIPVVSQTKFTPETADGIADVVFEVDSSLLEGETVVVFESVYYKDVLIGIHANIEDEDQFIFYPKMKTFASDASIIIDGETKYNGETGTHTGVVKGHAIVNDIVKYENLLADTEYTIKGRLVNKETGALLLATASAEVNTLTIKAETAGLDMYILVDGVEIHATELDDGSVYVFENVPNGEYDVFYNGGKMHVSYKNGGVDVDGGAPIIEVSAGTVSHNVGTPITATRTFRTPAAEEGRVVSGEVTLTYVLDSLQVEGDRIVVFEDLYMGDVLVDSHSDINDADQTVNFPSVRTTAFDIKTKDQVVSLGEEVEIHDIVSYTNLIPGMTYQVSGRIMDKDTRSELLDADGEMITAFTEFVPEEKDGTVELIYHIDTTKIEGKTLVVFEILYEEGIILNRHEDFEDKDQTLYVPELHTTAVDGKTETHTGVVSKETTVIDEVVYRNLVPGKTYGVDGILMNQKTGKAVLGADGKEIHGVLMDKDGKELAKNEFVAEKADGSVKLIFRVDSTLLRGEDVVVFENLLHEGILVGAHAELEDETQTVHYPEIGTTAKDSKSGDSQGTVIDGKVTLIDTVHYKNLVPGESYLIKGILYDKATGKPALDMFGDEITSTSVLTLGVNAKEDGDALMFFTFDVSDAEGKTFVVFEYLTQHDIVLTSHEDIEDEGQTVDYPRIRTTAVDGITKDEDHIGALDEKATIIDSVKFNNLRVGETYRVSGVLKDKETGKDVLDKNGKAIVAEKTFVATTPDGSVDLVYSLDSTLLAGKTVVVFEDLYKGDKLIAVHASLDDEEQSVHYPSIGTTATVDNGKKQATASAKTELVDVVSYTNLVVGKKYVVKGTLMDSKTAKPIEVGGKVLTAESEFTAETTDGTIEMKFIFDSTGLGGKRIVVFEEIYEDDNIMIASHKDINDAAQSVDITTPPPTGDDNTIAVAGAAAVAFAAAGAILMAKKKKEDEAEVE